LIAVSGVNAINSLVAFYDIHGRKREVLFFYFVPDTTRDWLMTLITLAKVGRRMGDQNLLSRALYFGNHVKPLFPLHLQSLTPTSFPRRVDVRHTAGYHQILTKPYHLERLRCFGRHVKPLVPAAFTVVSTHQSALGPRGGL
jgi:hypothetical protein